MIYQPTARSPMQRTLRKETSSEQLRVIAEVNSKIIANVPERDVVPAPPGYAVINARYENGKLWICEEAVVAFWFNIWLTVFPITANDKLGRSTASRCDVRDDRIWALRYPSGRVYVEVEHRRPGTFNTVDEFLIWAKAECENYHQRQTSEPDCEERWQRQTAGIREDWDDFSL
jgi:hypothetical protein